MSCQISKEEMYKQLIGFGIKLPSDTSHLKGMNACELMNELFPTTFLKGWHISKLLGRGVYGKTFLACNNKKKCGALKIASDHSREALEMEIKMQKRFFLLGHGIAPEVFSYHIIKVQKPSSEDCKAMARFLGVSPKPIEKFRPYVAFVFMEKIEGIMQSYLEAPGHGIRHMQRVVKSLISMYDKMVKAGIEHSDMHWENIAYKGNRAMLIDFGMATDKISYPLVDMVQSLRTLNKDFTRKMKEPNRRYLYTTLRRVYHHRYGASLEDLPAYGKWSHLEKVWNGKIDKYYRKYVW
jgi:tRNA A-37 threonylcarbamoyl transferase component Bud32